MRSNFGLSGMALSRLAGLSALALACAAPAAARPLDHDHVYADSFGNLVIESVAGYKRILVGEGHMAKELAGYTAAGQPQVLRFDGAVDDGPWADCYRPPVFVKGRSHMYGLSDGEMPELSPCR